MKLRCNPVTLFSYQSFLFDNDEKLITENKCFSPEANDKSNDTSYFLVLMI